MQIENIPVKKLREYKNNSRTHSEEQVRQIADSITEFGFTQPILVDGQNEIIAGHGRLMAAKLLGLAEVPCIRLTNLSPRQKRAYVITDNKLSLTSGWDFEKLSAEIDALVEMDFDVSVLGFNEQELESLLTSNVGLFPDEPAAVPTVQVQGYERKKYGDEPEPPQTRFKPLQKWVLGDTVVELGDDLVFIGLFEGIVSRWEKQTKSVATCLNPNS